MLTFTKMNGAGNDFIMLDNRDMALGLGTAEISLLCDRHRGIGADGMLVIEPANNGGDFRMRYYNADGNEAEMCGNGARCFARFVDRIDNRGGKRITFETMAGLVAADFRGDEIKLQLSNPTEVAMSKLIEINGQSTTVHSINTGVPHAVVVVDDIGHSDVCRDGAAIRYHQHFQPSGTNVNFQCTVDSNTIAIRTYERGVENETLACGTGMVASAIVHERLTGVGTPIYVRVRGGDTLKVDWLREGQTYTGVTLTGPADFVFEGEIHV
jgi:diaminopimelate epimerase